MEISSLSLFVSVASSIERYEKKKKKKREREREEDESDLVTAALALPSMVHPLLAKAKDEGDSAGLALLLHHQRNLNKKNVNKSKFSPTKRNEETMKVKQQVEEVEKSLKKKAMNGTENIGENGSGGSFGAGRSLFKRELPKKKGKKGGRKKSIAPLAQNGGANKDLTMKKFAKNVPESPIKSGRLSPHKELKIDSKGSYLVLPATDSRLLDDSISGNNKENAEGHTTATSSSLKSIPMAVCRNAARVVATIESIPLICGTLTGLALATFSGVLKSSSPRQ